jgi:hypothetical protein
MASGFGGTQSERFCRASRLLQTVRRAGGPGSCCRKVKNPLRSFPLPASYLEIAVRWTARVLAASLVGLVLAVFIGEGGFDPLKLTSLEAVQLFFLFAACLGMTAGWRWELLGGTIATAGILFFFAVEFAVTGGFPRGLVFHLMLLPGFLFLVSGLMKRRPLNGASY